MRRQAMLLVNSSTVAMGDTPILRELVDKRDTFKGPPEQLSALIKGHPARGAVLGRVYGRAGGSAAYGATWRTSLRCSSGCNGQRLFRSAQGIERSRGYGSCATDQPGRPAGALKDFIGLPGLSTPTDQKELSPDCDGLTNQATQDASAVKLKIDEPDRIWRGSVFDLGWGAGDSYFFGGGSRRRGSSSRRPR